MDVPQFLPADAPDDLLLFHQMIKDAEELDALASEIKFFQEIHVDHFGEDSASESPAESEVNHSVGSSINACVFDTPNPTD